MINGLLIYTENDALKNKWFINHLITVSKKYNINLKFLTYHPKMFEDDSILSGFDFCINRTRYGEVNRFFEARNVRCYNNLKTVTVANDKWLTYSTCRDIGVPVMDTQPIEHESTINFQYPFVVKARNGHGGNEVFWVNNSQALQNLSLVNPSGYIAQKPVSDLGVDVRVYVLGNKPIFGVKRTSDNDFRSNFSLGGNVEPFDPTTEQVRIIEKLQAVLSADYAGYDFIFHNGKWVLNEIEDVVGSRMLYSLSDRDVGEEFIQYIAKSIE